jgi:hypothetical protein
MINGPGAVDYLNRPDRAGIGLGCQRAVRDVRARTLRTRIRQLVHSWQAGGLPTFLIARDEENQWSRRPGSAAAHQTHLSQRVAYAWLGMMQ